MERISIVRFPRCGVQSEESMPTDACVYFFECPECHAVMKPRSGDCCIFCSYGTVPCPPVQEQGRCC